LKLAVDTALTNKAEALLVSQRETTDELCMAA
jgi:hypothetical protein